MQRLPHSFEVLEYLAIKNLACVRAKTDIICTQTKIHFIAPAYSCTQ